MHFQLLIIDQKLHLCSRRWVSKDNDFWSQEFWREKMCFVGKVVRVEKREKESGALRERESRVLRRKDRLLCLQLLPYSTRESSSFLKKTTTVFILNNTEHGETGKQRFPPWIALGRFRIRFLVNWSTRCRFLDGKKTAMKLCLAIRSR